MKDILGQDICVGDTIVWPLRQGSSVWMGAGTVCEINEAAPGEHYSNNSVKVQTIPNTSSWRYKQHKSRIAKIIATERITVVRRREEPNGKCQHSYD